MENKALKSIKTFRSKCFLVFLIFFTVMSLITILTYFMDGLSNRSVFGHLFNAFVIILTLTGWERRYTAIHNPSKIFNEVNKND